MLTSINNNDLMSIETSDQQNDNKIVQSQGRNWIKIAIATATITGVSAAAGAIYLASGSFFQEKNLPGAMVLYSKPAFQALKSDKTTDSKIKIESNSYEGVLNNGTFSFNNGVNSNSNISLNDSYRTSLSTLKDSFEIRSTNGSSLSSFFADLGLFSWDTSYFSFNMSNLPSLDKRYIPSFDMTASSSPEVSYLPDFDMNKIISFVRSYLPSSESCFKFFQFS